MGAAALLRVRLGRADEGGQSEPVASDQQRDEMGKGQIPPARLLQRVASSQLQQADRRRRRHGVVWYRDGGSYPLHSKPLVPSVALQLGAPCLLVPRNRRHSGIWPLFPLPASSQRASASARARAKACCPLVCARRIVVPNSNTHLSKPQTMPCWTCWACCLSLC